MCCSLFFLPVFNMTKIRVYHLIEDKFRDMILGVRRLIAMNAPEDESIYGWIGVGWGG